MDRLALVQREPAFGFEIVAKSPLTVDPKPFRFGLILKLTRELAVSIPVLIIHSGERETQCESAGQADGEKARFDALSRQNCDGQRNREQVTRGPGEKDHERSREKDEHPLGEKIAPLASAPDENANADRDGTPEERVPIIERGPNGSDAGERDCEERWNPERGEGEPGQMAGQRDSA